MRKLSELVGLDVFSDQGKRIGKVYDAILDLQQGVVVRLSLGPLSSLTKEDVVRQFKHNTVIYHNISSVGDSIIVSSKPFDRGDMLESPEGEGRQAPVPASKRHLFSYRYRR